MCFLTKNMGRNFAESKTLLNIALPSRCNYTASKEIRLPYGRILVSYLLCVVTAVWRLKGVRPLFIHTLTKFLSNTCQTATKICSRGTIVPELHHYPVSRRRSYSRSFTEIPFMNLSATTSSIVVPLPPCPDGACASAMAGSGRPRRTVSRTGSTPCVAFT